MLDIGYSPGHKNHIYYYCGSGNRYIKVLVAGERGIKELKMKKILVSMVFFMFVFLFANAYGRADDDFILTPPLKNVTSNPDFIVYINIQTESECIHKITKIENALFEKVYGGIYKKISKIPGGLPTGTSIGITLTPESFFFNFELNEQLISEKIVVDFGPVFKTFGTQPNPITIPIPTANIKIANLENPNMECSLKVKIYESQLDLLKDKEGATVFSTNLSTIKKRPRLGIQAGIILTFFKMNSYRLEYKNIALKEDKSNIEDTYPIIRKDGISPMQNIKPIIFLTYLFSRRYNLHFNFGTEIGQSVLKTWIGGVGHRIGDISINLFIKRFKNDILITDGYNVDETIKNPNVKEVPVSKENKWAVCLSVSTPLNIFTGFIGKIFGI